MIDRPIYGSTVAKALVLLDQADVALVRVPTVAGETTLLGIDPKLIRSAIAAHSMDAMMPTTLYRDGITKIEIGSELAGKNALLASLKSRVDARLNNCLCEMKEGYDDSIVGFIEAWDIVREIFADELEKAQPAKAV